MTGPLLLGTGWLWRRVNQLAVDPGALPSTLSYSNFKFIVISCDILACNKLPELL